MATKIKHVFDRKALILKPLRERTHDLALSIIKDLSPSLDIKSNKDLSIVADRVLRSKIAGVSNIFIFGAHVIRSGTQRYIIDLMERGYISCIALNGAGVIHDFEFALIGATTENVARYIQEGQFGLWKETGYINDIINKAYKSDNSTGFGEAVGREINSGDYPFKEISILSAAYRLNIPVTVHVGIGYDIIHEHPNFDGAATGALSYNDFLTFASIVSGLEGGVVANFGSAVMAPEVFLKTLSMARNVANQEGRTIKKFTTLVCDLYSLCDDFREGPSKSNPAYYFRPWKTMLVRTVAEGGESYYVNGRHDETIPTLWNEINSLENIS